MSTDAGGSGGRFPSSRVVLAATGAAVVAAGAAYYVYSSSSSSSTPKKPAEAPRKSQNITFEDLKKWKEEGNTHFIQKRFPEAIDRFSAVVDELSKTKKHDQNANSDSDEAAEYADLLALCYQNRAAAKQASGESPLEVIADCSHAIALKPRYGKAYIRRSQLLKTMEPKQALADALAAMHIDEKFGDQMVGIMGDLMGALEKANMDDFRRMKENKPNKKPQPITHDQVFSYLNKTLTDEHIRNLYYKKVECSSESLQKAFDHMRKREFEAALAAIEKSEELECLLLSARLNYYRGSVEKFESALSQFETLSANSEHPNLDQLKLSYALLRIETADSMASLLQLFSAATDSYGALPDLFSTAAFRCTFYDSWEQALTILTDPRLVHSSLSQILCFFVQINSIILRNENPMDAFKIIAKFEEFVDAMEEFDVHKNWAAFALSKIYITFNNLQNAEVLMKELMKRDASWSVYPVALGHVYTQKSSYKEALEMAEKAIKMEKVNPEAHLLVQSLKLHSQGNKLEPSSYYVNLRSEAESLLSRCLSDAEFPFVNEVLRHIAFIDAKSTAANSLCL